MADVRGDARVNLDIIGRLGMPIVEVADAQAWELHALAGHRAPTSSSTRIVGTGLSRALTGLHETVVADLNASPTTGGVDRSAVGPVGRHQRAASGRSLQADITVTLGAPKVPLVLPPAEHAAGDVVIADIGIPQRRSSTRSTGPRLYLLTREYVRTLVPAARTRRPQGRLRPRADRRRVARHDRRGGADGARGALRAGAGLVTVATPASVQPIVAALGAEFMTAALDDADGA